MEELIMRKSARILGQDYGLTAQEMNHIFREEGYLDGEPGGYTVTAKGSPYAEEEYFHRGTGGYAHYNRYWTTRTWDDSILNDLKITDEMKNNARNVVSSNRQAHWDEIKAARAEADNSYYATKDEECFQPDELDDTACDDNSDALAGLLVGGLVILGYGIYKAAPYAAKWWKTSVAPKFKKQTKEQK